VMHSAVLARINTLMTVRVRKDKQGDKNGMCEEQRTNDGRGNGNATGDGTPKGKGKGMGDSGANGNVKQSTGGDNIARAVASHLQKAVYEAG
jgi:hypothetical protein